MITRDIVSIILLFLFLGIAGCTKPNKTMQEITYQAQDIKRIELYNQLDNLKEGIWHVDKWKKFAHKICDESKGKDCSVMGEIYYDYFYGYGSKADKQKALHILERGCSLNDSRSCFKLAILGNQSDFSIEKSNNLFVKTHTLALKGCDANYAMDCYVLALLYFEGYSIFDRDRGKSKKIASKSCAMKHASSCIFLGINADTRDEAQAAYKQACVAGVKQFCK